MFREVRYQGSFSKFINLLNIIKMKSIHFFRSNEFVSLFVGSFFIYFFSPFLINGKDSFILIHDNFDQGWTTLKILYESGQLFKSSHNEIVSIMNGVPRGYFSSEFSYIFILLNFMDIFWVSILNRFIQVLIGFLGMQLLLKNHFNYDYKNQNIVIAGVSLCFGFLPFWPLGMLSVAGQPLLINSFLNLRKKQYSYYDWSIIVIFPLLLTNKIFNFLHLFRCKN